jgi:hypothetical protein
MNGIPLKQRGQIWYFEMIAYSNYSRCSIDVVRYLYASLQQIIVAWRNQVLPSDVHFNLGGSIEIQALNACILFGIAYIGKV